MEFWIKFLAIDALVFAAATVWCIWLLKKYPNRSDAEKAFGAVPAVLWVASGAMSFVAVIGIIVSF